ncbi:DUF1903-domain-containing protein, partial [Artomyces pyxidatus]
SEPPCQAEACSLQTCISGNTYAPERCEQRMRELYRCCQTMYENTDGKGESTACPMPKVVRRWLSAHPDSLSG